MPVLTCPIEEQVQVVQEIESRLSVCDKMEETINASLQQAEALRQSILKRAFEGKLVMVEKEVKLNTLIQTEAERDWQRKVLAGKIIEICHADRNFGHTKFQKVQYICENHAQLRFNTGYLKEVAGPFDRDFFFPFIEEGKINNWFAERPKQKAIFFRPGDGLKDLTKDYDKIFRDQNESILFIINLLDKKNTSDCELVATIYAIWNNYLITGDNLDITQLITEVYDWSESKIKFTPADISNMWQWMKDVNLVPVGFGKLIEKIA